MSEGLKRARAAANESENLRHVLRLTREPGADAVLTIDGEECRIVRVKVTPDVTEVVYEEG